MRWLSSSSYETQSWMDSGCGVALFYIGIVAAVALIALIG
jgi:hypothetical protein